MRVGMVVLIVVLVTVLIIAFAGTLVLTIFKVMDRTAAHVCGLALVQRSPAAIRLLGSPIEQHGLTGGRTTNSNGDDLEHITFWVRGPLGDAFVVSEGDRSPIGSHLGVRIGRNGAGETIYSGPFDCPELHR
jgi:hypothetical protein